MESMWEDDRRASIESRPEGLKWYPWLGGLANVAWVERWASKAEMECTSGNEMVSMEAVSVDIGTFHRFVRGRSPSKDSISLAIFMTAVLVR